MRAGRWRAAPPEAVSTATGGSRVTIRGTAARDPGRAIAHRRGTSRVISVVVPVRNGHAVAGGPAAGPGRPGVRRASGRSIVADNGSTDEQPGSRPAVGRAPRRGSGASTPPRCTGPRRARNAGVAGGRRATCSPSATPTTWSSPAGSPAAPGPRPGRRGRRGLRLLVAQRTAVAPPPRPASMRQLGIPPGRPGRQPRRAPIGLRGGGRVSPRSCSSARTSTCAGACSSRASAS